MGFSERMAGVVDGGVAASRRAVALAGEAVQRLGERGAVLVERRRLEAEREAQVRELGRVAAALLITDGRAEVRADESPVRELLDGIRALDAGIAAVGSDGGEKSEKR